MFIPYYIQNLQDKDLKDKIYHYYIKNHEKLTIEQKNKLILICIKEFQKKESELKLIKKQKESKDLESLFEEIKNNY